MVRAIGGMLLADRKRAKDLTFMLSERMDQLAMANSLHWYCSVLRRVDVDALRSTLEFEVKGLGRKWRLWMILKEQVE